MITQSLISEIVSKQRQFFYTGATRDVSFRVEQLRNLKQGIMQYEHEITQALKADLNKPEFEVYGAEFSLIFTEIADAIKHLKNWVKPQRKGLELSFLPGSAYLYPEPLGVGLIIGPWNYPFQLSLLPLVGAIASGNCAIVKPSEIASHTSHVINDVISKVFPREYIAVVEGGVETTQELLQEKFDHIFFTGGTAVGKIIMKEAAKHLTPVTLELGGKSPCIVDTDINLEVSARRIAWGKFLNAGQTCIAPDYLLVNKSIKQDLLKAIADSIKEFYGDNPIDSPDYCRIISEKHYTRLINYIEGDIYFGGEYNSDKLFIAPTVINNVSWQDSIMEEEIFGPILPVIEYEDINEVIAAINSRPKPLALYLFTNNKDLQGRILRETSSGGVCINDTIKHCGVASLPFGGVGDSGIGKYHGKASFDVFSHYKSVLKRGFGFDMKVLYPPYEGKLALLKRVFGKN
ncbi:aldehyde dehydrogenase [Dulcicalothrix desertica PCC 7102]|uniref:Aldehyde dehydrogenase n=1 Tax=Dulcicalothrix desertica PCC 7102 TaxID=232991 RepID=A0A433VU90_9CYAN|nr:aldehyde dehydrogenase [Dulcicalothrix desertica]RUT09649.1 aldehyde dehydrogenase [Dulcicalothrix desertica PCC 7102]TWH50845.1 aldehyde dehydrogenase (NAD+) [Dulcicalothrix desertica PCC 7102]